MTPSARNNNFVQNLIRTASCEKPLLYEFYVSVFVLFIVPLFLFYPIANNERFAWMYVIPAKSVMAFIKSFFEQYGFQGSWSIVFALIITGILLSLIAVNATMLGHYFFREKNTYVFISDIFLVVFPYWGITTFYLFKIAKDYFLLYDIVAFNGYIAVIICKSLIPFVCLSVPLYSLFKMKKNLIEAPVFLFAKKPSFSHFKIVLRTVYYWTKYLAVPWGIVALAIIHKNVLLLV